MFSFKDGKFCENQSEDELLKEVGKNVYMLFYELKLDGIPPIKEQSKSSESSHSLADENIEEQKAIYQDIKETAKMVD